MPTQFTVWGAVTDARQQPQQGLVVRAFDADLPLLGRDDFLGTATTDAEGRYLISYDDTSFRQREYRRPDLYIAVFGRDDTLLGRSRTRFNCEDDERIDLTVDRRPQQPASEYEQLLAVITPLIDPLTPAHLRPVDIEFLGHETAIDARRLNWLAAASALARETAVPAEAFYGWARRDPPLPQDWLALPDERDLDVRRTVLQAILGRLANLRAEELAWGLQAAVEDNTIPDIRARVDDIIAAVRQTRLVAHRSLGRLVDERTGAGIGGLRVRVTDSDDPAQQANTEDTSTTDEGLFVIAFMAPPSPDGRPVRRNLRIAVLNSVDTEQWATDAVVASDAAEILELRITPPREPEPVTHTIDRLTEDLQIDVPADLQRFLAEQNIRTLADIRRSGGLSQLAGLPVPTEHPAVRTLSGQADLARLSRDVAANSKVMAKGFGSVADIAAESAAGFVESLHEQIGDFEAARLHVMARAQTSFLRNVVTDLATDRANGFKVLGADGDPAVDGALDDRCGCDDCEAAVSPAAFLTELIGYIASHVKHSGGPADVAYLQQTFHQPFGDLPTDCEAVDELVRQVRLCIEVLRNYLGAYPPDGPTTTQLQDATRRYLFAAYSTSLAKIGTSYEEVRLARTADDETRRAFAERLGIDLTVPRPDPATTDGDELDQLFLDPDGDPADSNALTEPTLERLVGLADTTRDPLSDGVKFGDDEAAPEIVRWSFAGAAWSHNTDEDGLVHLTVHNFVTTAVNTYVEVYRDAARTQLVAAGTASAASGNRTVKLISKNGSRLTGAATVAGTFAEDTGLSVALVPKLVAWRLRNLRTVWRRQDFPVDVFDAEYAPAADRRPVIDPDVVGPDDFRRPTTTDDAFSLWRTRRLWVDQRLAALASLTKTIVAGTRTHTVPDLDKVFAHMYAATTYDTTTVNPWLSATPVSQFDALADTFERGTTTQVALAFDRVKGDLNLSVEAFTQLVRVRNKHRAWELDPKSEAVQDDEWQRFFSLLIRATKLRFYPAWSSGEEAQTVRFGPRTFWPAVRAPREGAWPPARSADRPLIDPELLKLTDLPEPAVGAAAIELWADRRDALADATAALKAEREANGFDAMMRRALGHPASGNPLQHDLVTIRTDLVSADATVVAAATDKVVKHLHLTVDGFNRVMTMRDQTAPDSPRTPTASEWYELYVTLTSAHKEKHLYPKWVAEENANGMSVEYWRAIKAALPAGLVLADERQDWQRGLAIRSRPPLIDPDLVGVDTIAPNASAALALWEDRRTWIANQIAVMAAQPKTLATLDSLLESALATSVPTLVALNDSRKAGEAIQPRLDQIPLTNAAFVYVSRIRDLLVAGQPVMDTEWNNVYSILAQVAKRWSADDWRNEEKAAKITLSPDAFVSPPAGPAEPLPPELRWRTNQEERFDWLDTLTSRQDQELGLLAGLRDTVDSVEEAALPALRDALVSAGAAGTDVAAKAAWLTDRLLIDMRAGGCQRTTRIAQAIETLQMLLFSTRSGQSTVLQSLKLTLHAPDFDEEIRWLGSYATFRAAMFVFMYPENIAAPNLRRRQTPAFRALVKELRGNRRLTSEQACGMAADYARYYEDVAKLSIGASAQATVNQRSGTPCVPGVITRKALIFLFGRGGVTQRLMFSTFDPADTTGYAQSFWDYVPGVPQVTSVRGVAVYERSATDRRVFVFVRTSDYKLQFVTYDLESGQWNGPTDLAVPPGDPRSLEIVVDQNSFMAHMPRLTVRSGNDFYFRTLSPDGTGWEDGDWKNFLIKNSDANLVGITGLYAQVDGMLLVREARQLEWRFPGPPQRFESTTADLVDAEYRGAVYWGKARNSFTEYLVGKKANGVIYEDHIVVGSTLLASGWPLEGLRYVAPNSGHVDHASYAYERRIEASTGGKKLGRVREWDGVYLRLVELEPTLTDSQIHSKTYRIAPQVLPNAVGQFLIPARLEGTAADVRRNTVRLVLAASADSLTNRTYAEEAYFFVPMLLCDALRRAGEFVAALDRARTVLDYTSPADRQKIYYGLVEEEVLSDAFKRASDWLRDPLDPHAIAASRRLTYTRATLQTIVRLLLEFADDEYTRDTSESVPRARALYLQALAVLDFPELKQYLGTCDDVIGTIDIPLGPGVPAKAAAGVGQLLGDLKELKHYEKLVELVPKVTQALQAGDDWAERLAAARALVDDVAASEPASPTVSDALRIGADAAASVSAKLLASPDVSAAADRAGRLAGAQLLSTVATAAGLTPAEVDSPATQLPWLRTSGVTSFVKDLDYAIGPDLRPIALQESASLAGLFDPPPPIADVFSADMLRPLRPIEVLLPYSKVVPGPGVLPPPSPVKPVLGPSLAFCIPPNPILSALRLRAELNLYKIRTCRNIAGMKRDLDPYVAPTDTVSGLPTIGANGQLVLPGVSTLRPTLYRYDLLLQRSKELVGIAGQMEASMLAAIEKRDAEAYSMLRARQDLDLAQAGVQLETLRLKQANDGVTLASLQQVRAQLQVDHYEKLLDEGLSELENSAIEMLGEAAALQAAAATWSFAAAAVYGAAAVAGAIAGAGAGAVAGGPLGAAGGGAAGAVVGGLAGGLGGIASSFASISSGYSSNAAKRQTRSQIALTLASFERRRQEWELSVTLARQDIAIGAAQVTLATDTVDIVKQQKLIADITNTHAKDTVSFLANKFTNAELYDWMSDVLEGVYGFFLQQATSTARLAETQLAFERQEPLAALIGNDYWQTPDDGMGAENGQAPDRRGLTGSARLLEDLYRLDQYAFETNKRKLQLTKSISLALTVPNEFQTLRETGVMRFTTPMKLFDRDFPGHYLRLIRSVRVSVIALVPPVEGIHATLASTGVSRVVIGPDIFQTAPIRRDPELVALTSPVAASGVFDLDAQSMSMLAPFEGCGVDTSWELRMPKAANFFDFRSVADVLMTIDYTALHSWDYSQQVIESLRQSTSGERPFSFRNQLPDQWYNLHNPEQTATPMVVKFQTMAEDFPPNINGLKIQHAVLHFARRSGSDFEVPVQWLRFTEAQAGSATGGAANTMDGTVSTRRGNAGSWMSLIGKRPVGEWELALPNTEEIRGRFTSEDIEDILFVLTYGGRTHEWPA